MRRAVAKLVQAAGAAQSSSSSANAQASVALPQLVRQMGGGHSGPAPETPLSKIMPSLVVIPRQVLTTALSLTGKLVVGAAKSGAVKGAVTSFAEEVLLKEQFVKLSELDVSFWTYWLSTSGYASQGGFKRLAEAATGKVADLEASQVANLVVGFHTASYYDKALFDAVSAHVAANFTKYETDELLKLLSAFADFGHYSSTLFDDVADSITYCNHYLAPIKAPVGDVIKGLSAFAKFGHERADTFVALARGISEISLSELPADERRAAVVAGLRAFKKFNFYPEQVDALLYFTESEPSLFSADEVAEAAAVRAAVEEQSGGKLSVYKENADEDAAHWYAHHAHHAPAHHELYVLRDALVPKAYSPASLRSDK